MAEFLKVAIYQRTAEQRKKVMDYYRGIARPLLRLPAAWEGGRKPRAVDPRLQQLRGQLSAAQQPVLVDPQVQQLRDDVKLSEQQLATARLIWTQDLAWALINSPAFLFNH